MGVAVAGEVITTSRLVLCPSDLPSCPRQEHGTDRQWHGDSRGTYFRQPGRGRRVILGLRPVKGRSKVHSLPRYTFNSPHHHHSPSLISSLSLSLSQGGRRRHQRNARRRRSPPPTRRPWSTSALRSRSPSRSLRYPTPLPASLVRSFLLVLHAFFFPRQILPVRSARSGTGMSNAGAPRVSRLLCCSRAAGSRPSGCARCCWGWTSAARGRTAPPRRTRTAAAAATTAPCPRPTPDPAPATVGASASSPPPPFRFFHSSRCCRSCLVLRLLSNYWGFAG